MKMLLFAIFLCCLSARVTASCYIENGCADYGREKTYKVGQSWTPKYDPCYSCYCYSSKKIAKICTEEVNAEDFNVRKSTVANKGNLDEEVPQDQEVEINENDVASIQCPQVRPPAFNYLTWEFEETEYRKIFYYYTVLQSTCCSKFRTYSNVPPNCKVVKTGRCKNRLVQKNDPRKECEPISYSMTF